MNAHAMKWAIAKLREYAADDECDCERLTPLLKAYDFGDMPEFFKKCKEELFHYYAGNVFIEELYWYAYDNSKLDTTEWMNKFAQL